MNLYIISQYLQLLRKKHGFTQEDLAKQLHISRQAISKWETGNTIPNLEILLKLSKLYDVSINDILEPNIPHEIICIFEEINKLSKDKVKQILSNFDINDIVKAAMGASPEVNEFLQSIYVDTDFESRQLLIGRVPVGEIEEVQNEIVNLINLQL